MAINVPQEVRALFCISVSTTIGDGANTSFWQDRWMHGKTVAELAPTVMPFVRKRVWKRRTVQQAMVDNSWTQDIIGGLPIIAVNHVLQLLDIMAQVAFVDQKDVHAWTPDESGQFSTRSAYERHFTGGITLEPYRRLWRTWSYSKSRSSFGLQFGIAVGLRIDWLGAGCSIQIVVCYVNKRQRTSIIF